MNRPLKFRVWNKKEKQWATPNSLEINSLYGNMLAHRNDPTAEYTVIQQFTGMLDSNGDEIYEGDILKGRMKDAPSNHQWRVFLAQWNEENGFEWRYWDLTSIVIVGNIFESENV